MSFTIKSKPVATVRLHCKSSGSESIRDTIQGTDNQDRESRNPGITVLGHEGFTQDPESG